MNTPKLRFKEFDGDWSNKKIGNIASKVGSGSTPRGGSEAYTDHGVIFIRSQNVNNDQLLLDDVAYIPEKTHLKMSGSKVIANDVLLNITGASIGRSCVVPHDFTEANVNQHVCIIRTPNDHPIFVQSFLSSENGQNAIQSKQAGGGREGLNFQAIRAIDFYFPPSKEEQTKIASFLSVVDEKISQLTQKNALLSQYKQGMMQKLFSQQIRFKADDGSDFREWEEKKLSEISQKAMYGMNAAATEYDGINKYLRITDICEFSNKFKMSNLTSPNAELEDKYKLQLGDLLFARTGASVGKSYLYNEDDGITYFAGFLIKFSLNINLVIPYFIFLQTLTKEFSQWVVTNSMRSGQPGINAEEYSSYILKVPCLEEQTKIANFLSAIDQKIEVVAQQIEQAKVWKKGLLQQMFV